MADSKLDAYNIFDLREQALSRVPKGLFEFCDRGTEDEVSLRNNRAVFDRIRFKPRTLVDVSKRSLETTILGVKHRMPMVIAPTGTAGLLWYEGEIALAKAARDAGIPFTLATGSMTAMERVADEAGGELWFQLYMWPDRSLSQKLVERAKAAGYKALVVTVDGVHAGNREYNIRNGFTIPPTLSVSTDHAFLPHLCERRQLFMFPDLGTPEADAVLLDLQATRRFPAETDRLRSLPDLGFREAFRSPGDVVLYVRGPSPWLVEAAPR